MPTNERNYIFGKGEADVTLNGQLMQGSLVIFKNVDKIEVVAMTSVRYRI